MIFFFLPFSSFRNLTAMVYAYVRKEGGIYSLLVYHPSSHKERPEKSPFSLSQSSHVLFLGFFLWGMEGGPCFLWQIPLPHSTRPTNSLLRTLIFLRLSSPFLYLLLLGLNLRAQSSVSLIDHEKDGPDTHQFLQLSTLDKLAMPLHCTSIGGSLLSSSSFYCIYIPEMPLQ